MLSHKQPNLAVISPTQRQEILRRLLHRTCVTKPDAHQTALALVCQAFTYQLDHHRKPKTLSRRHCLLGVWHDGFAGKQRAASGQHLLRFVFAQCA